MGAGYFVYEGASGTGAAFDGAKVCGLLGGDGIADQEFPGDGFLVDTGNSFVQLLDCDWRVSRRCGVVGRTEKDNAETQRAQNQRREGEERHRGKSGNEREDRLATGSVSRGFSVLVLCDSC